MKSNALRMKQAADDFYRLASKETDGFYHGTLVGLRTAVTILDDQGLENHINTLLAELKKQRPE